VSQTWFRANSAHAAQILPFQLFRHHHHVLRWDWHFRSTLWYHKTRLSHPNYPHLSQGRNQCRRRGSGPFGTCSSNSNVPLFRTTMCCGGIGTSDPPSGTIRQFSHPNYHTYPRDATSVETWFGANSAHAAQILPFQLFNTTTMCCGGIGTSDPPLVP
jgi:hypothetical protein